MLTKKIDIKVKKTENANKAFIKEINMLKLYIENLEKSLINKWINTTTSEERDFIVINYIRGFV